MLQNYGDRLLDDLIIPVETPAAGMGKLIVTVKPVVEAKAYTNYWGDQANTASVGVTFML